jgi:hypothetical protein
MKKYAQLHQYLIDLAVDLRALKEQNNVNRLSMTIGIELDYDEMKMKYTTRFNYESGPTGDNLEAVLQECVRRYNWDVSNNTKLLT